MLTRGKILICPACVKIFSNLCKAKRSFKPNMHPYDSEIENRRVRQENIIVIMNISFHRPPIGYFLESHISWSSGKIFPRKWSLVNAQQKKTNKNGQKKWKKGEREEAKGRHREGSVSFKQNILKFFHFSPKLQKLQFCTRNRLKPELF